MSRLFPASWWKAGLYLGLLVALMVVVFCAFYVVLEYTVFYAIASMVSFVLAMLVILIRQILTA